MTRPQPPRPLLRRPSLRRNWRAWGRPVLFALASLLLCAAIVRVWAWVSAAGLVSRAFLPAPDRTWTALVNGLARGPLWNDLLATVGRMALGWLLASLAGILLGALVGTSPAARRLLGPTLEFLRPLPASALVPVGIALFGLTNAMVVGVICFGTVWPTLLATVTGFAAAEPRLAEVARLLHLGRWATIRIVSLPGAVPEILAGMRLGLTVALILSVVGEMLAGQQGLGLRILLAARAFRAPDLFAGILLLGAVGLLSNTLLAAAERRLLRWRPAHPS